VGAATFATPKQVHLRRQVSGVLFTVASAEGGSLGEAGCFRCDFTCPNYVSVLGQPILPKPPCPPSLASPSCRVEALAKTEVSHEGSWGSMADAVFDGVGCGSEAC